MDLRRAEIEVQRAVLVPAVRGVPGRRLAGGVLAARPALVGQQRHVAAEDGVDDTLQRPAPQVQGDGDRIQSLAGQCTQAQR